MSDNTSSSMSAHNSLWASRFNLTEEEKANARYNIGMEKHQVIIDATEDDFYGSSNPTDIWYRAMRESLQGNDVYVSIPGPVFPGLVTCVMLHVDNSIRVPEDTTLESYLATLHDEEATIPFSGKINFLGVLVASVSGYIYPDNDSSNGGIFIEYNYSYSDDEGLLLKWSHNLSFAVTAGTYEIQDGTVVNVPEKVGYAYKRALSLGEYVVLNVSDTVQGYGIYSIKGRVTNISIDSNTNDFTLEVVGVMTKTVSGVTTNVFVDYKGTFSYTASDVETSLHLLGATIIEAGGTEFTYTNNQE